MRSTSVEKLVELRLVLALVVVLVAAALYATVCAVGYHDLRRAKEGVTRDRQRLPMRGVGA